MKVIDRLKHERELVAWMRETDGMPWDWPGLVRNGGRYADRVYDSFVCDPLPCRCVIIDGWCLDDARGCPWLPWRLACDTDVPGMRRALTNLLKKLDAAIAREEAK